jgi:hypothetical protein
MKPLDLTKDEYGWISVGYEDLVESFAEIVDCTDCGSYQGDLVYALRSETGEPGILICGYGSCSYCDALQAAGDEPDAIIALRDSIANDVVWGQYNIENRDWEGATWGLYDPCVRAAIYDYTVKFGFTPPFSREADE